MDLDVKAFSRIWQTQAIHSDLAISKANPLEQSNLCSQNIYI